MVNPHRDIGKEGIASTARHHTTAGFKE